jgi:YD repeat-containing protein
MRNFSFVLEVRENSSTGNPINFEQLEILSTVKRKSPDFFSKAAIYSIFFNLFVSVKMIHSENDYNFNLEDSSNDVFLSALLQHTETNGNNYWTKYDDDELLRSIKELGESSEAW